MRHAGARSHPRKLPKRGKLWSLLSLEMVKNCPGKCTARTGGLNLESSYLNTVCINMFNMAKIWHKLEGMGFGKAGVGFGLTRI